MPANCQKTKVFFEYRGTRQKTAKGMEAKRPTEWGVGRGRDAERVTNDAMENGTEETDKSGKLCTTRRATERTQRKRRIKSALRGGKTRLTD